MSTRKGRGSTASRAGGAGRRTLPPKLTAPGLRNLYDRERLYAQLDGLRREQRAIWISAPGGSGKTSLVLGYLAARALPALWYSVDAGDGDAASFLYYLGLAITRSFPRFRTPMPALTPEYLGDVTTFARNFFRELYRRLPPGHVVVLDDYQEAPERSALHAIVHVAIREAPAGATLLVLSRADAPPALAPLDVKGLVGHVDGADLQLTPDETVRVVAQRLPDLALDDAAVRRLHATADGWAAGVVLLAEQARQLGAASAGAAARRGQQVIFDYFASELFARADAEVQRFLARTALLPRVTAEVAAALTENRGAAAILEDLTRRNYFTVRHPGAQGDYFEYHPLFREFLVSQAARLFPAEDLAAMRRRAAGALEALGELDAAVELYLHAAAWDEAAALALRQAPAITAQGRGNTLLSWLTRLPEAYQAQAPWTGLWIGLCTLPSDPDAAIRALEGAYLRFKETGDVTGRYAAWCAIVDAVVLGWGNFAPLDPWLDEAEELQGVPPPSEDVASRFACAMFVALMYRRPERRRVAPWEAKAWDVVMYGGDPGARVLVGYNLVIYHAWITGDLRKAGAVVDVLRPLADRSGASALTRTGFAATAGASLWMSGRADACLQEVRKGLAAADASGVHVWDAMLCTQALFALIPYERAEEAGEFFARLERLLPHARPMDRALHHFFRGWVELGRGAAAEAELHFRAAMELGEAAGAIYPRAVFQWALAIALHHAGERAQVRGLLDDALRAGEHMQSATLLYEVPLAGAELHLLAGDERAAVEETRRFLAIGRARGFRCHALWRAGLMARLYALALRYGIEPEYVTSMVRQFHLPPPEGDVPVAWPWETRVFALGRLRVERHGASVVESGVHSTRPITLLLALVVARGAGISESRLIELLWPDSAGAPARQTLRVTLHRLRRLVGEDTVVTRDGRVFLDRTRCWADVWELDRVASAAREAAVRPVCADELLRLADALRSVYQGRLFEPGSGESFLLLEAERLHDLALQACAAVASQLQARDALDELLKVVAWGLELEPSAETLYQLEMRAHLALRQPASGLLAYERCRRMLATRAAARPSPQTEALAETLRHAIS